MKDIQTGMCCLIMAKMCQNDVTHIVSGVLLLIIYVHCGAYVFCSTCLLFSELPFKTLSSNTDTFYNPLTHILKLIRDNLSNYGAPY